MQQIRYVEYSPLIVRDITSLKTTDEPIFMSARRQAIVVVNSTASRGIDVRWSTYVTISIQEFNIP